ncbi:MAG: hypothetical protein KGI58_00550 [Patescibacteria group bacterium]|nr:hypothetical protein [Patescibacteria group bacterium]
MQNITNKIKNLFNKKNIQKQSVINPHKHWIILLKVFFVILFCLVLLSIYLLYKIKNDEIFQVTPTIQRNSTVLKYNLLKNVTSAFDQKAQNEEDLLSNPPTFKDPSK